MFFFFLISFSDLIEFSLYPPVNAKTSPIDVVHWRFTENISSPLYL
jgi:hypothetical protein